MSQRHWLQLPLALPLGARLSLLPLLGALPVLVLALVNADLDAAARREESARHAAESAQTAAAAQDAAVDRIGHFLQTVGGLVPVRTFDPDTCDSTIATAVAGQPLLQTLVVLDRDGFIGCNSHGYRSSKSFLDRPDVAAAIASRRPFLAPPAESPRTGEIAVSILLAQFEPPAFGGGLRSILIGTFDPGHLPEMVASAIATSGTAAAPPSRWGFVIDQQGRLVRRIGARPDAPLPSPALVAAMLASPRGSAVGADLSGTELLVGFARAERTGVTIGIAEPLAPLEARAASDRRSVLLAGFLATALGAVLSLGMAHWLVRRPVDRLVEATEAIAAGEYAAGQRIGSLPGELDHARHALIRMAELLRLREVESEASQRLLSREASTDPLTGLANRRAFRRSLDATLADAAAQDRPVALLLVDVDHFKAYNDTYGHPAGDRCLVHLARLLESIVRTKGDVASRIGGEEFGLVLADTGLAGAILVADRLRRILAEVAIPHTASATGRVTVSIGVATGSGASLASADALLGDADRNLYAAKRTGRDRCWPSAPTASGSAA